MPKGREPRRHTIEVTEKDIARAHKNNSYMCVVAQAIARAIPDSTRIEVDTQAIRFTSNGERLVYLTPYAVQGYVIAFDAGDKIEPFSFLLREPVRVKRQGRTARGREVEKVRTRARRAIHRRAKAANIPVTDPAVVADVRAAYAASVKDTEAANEPIRVTSDGERKAPPRVFKKRDRKYGHRLLRINRVAPPTPAAPPLDAPAT